MQRLRSFVGGCLSALLSVFVVRQIVKDDPCYLADREDFRRSQAMSAKATRIVMDGLRKTDGPKMGTVIPNPGTCDNPDHSTIPNRGQWKRCDLCGHARLKGVR